MYLRNPSLCGIPPALSRTSKAARPMQESALLQAQPPSLENSLKVVLGVPRLSCPALGTRIRLPPLLSTGTTLPSTFTMDATTAIGLASDIISFIDFACKSIKAAEELYHSEHGATKENERMGDIVGDLKEFSLGLGASLPSATKHERAIEALAKECAAVSDELIDILDKLRLSKSSRRRSIMKVLSGAWKRSEIAALEARLGEYRAQMNVRLMAAMKYAPPGRSPTSRHLLTMWASDKQSSIKSQLDAIESEAGEMSSSSAAELKTLREEVIRLLSSPERVPGQSPTDPLAGLGEQLQKLQLAAGITERETRILKQLYFKELFYREDSIEDACEGTFEWILEPEGVPSEVSSSDKDDETEKDNNGGGDDHSDDVGVESSSKSDHYELDDVQIAAKSLLQEWLAHGYGVFHISGKTGAGKSTLMKLLFNHPQTRQFLEEWAGDKELILVPFFFWNSGTELQKTLQGLYRCLLFHVLTQCPALIPELFPDQWQRTSTAATNSSLDSEMFRAPVIKKAFDRLMKTPLSSDRGAFCFFIDGLDEYDAHAYDHKQLVVQLCGWAKQSNIKLCVSSRPHVEFTDTFPSDLRIHLHELTDSDVRAFAYEMFESDPNFDRVHDVYSDLVNEIVWGAEGVFLWARLLLKTVLHEVGLRSTYERLLQKVRSLPREMDELYESLLAGLDYADRRRVDLMLYLVHMNPTKSLMTGIGFTWLDDPADPTFPSAEHLSRVSCRDDFYKALETVERQLSGLTKGLLVLSRHGPETPTRPDMLNYTVDFFHRTARDDLDTAPWRKHLKETFLYVELGDVHCRLRVAELVVLRSVWPGMSEYNRLYWKDTALTVQGHDRNFRQLTVDTMQVIDAHFHRSHQATFIPLALSRRDFMQQPVGSYEKSFPHYAAALHQTHYAPEALAISQAIGIQAHSAGECGYAQEMNPFFSATFYNSDPRYLSMLLEAGGLDAVSAPSVH